MTIPRIFTVSELPAVSVPMFTDPDQVRTDVVGSQDEPMQYMALESPATGSVTVTARASEGPPLATTME